MKESSEMAWGLYVHIPYCKSICPYCDFNAYVQPRKPPWQALEQALLTELRTRASLMDPAPVQSVYFGGGTPSLAPPRLFEGMLEGVDSMLGITPDAEITLEAEPKTVDTERLQTYRQVGINRISLGWQSTQDRLLRILGRGHQACESHAAFISARQAGFKNISIDLIFAVPGQSLSDLHADLDAVVALNPEHVSLYALTYHEGTPLYRRRAQGRLTPVDEELELAMMLAIEDRLVEAGFIHYEVSNYARSDALRAVHNSLYWTGGQYLGLGPGAHSFHHAHWKQGWRWEGTRKPHAYLQAWQHILPPGLPNPQDGTVGWIETLIPAQLLAERMLCGLRLLEGVALSEPICLLQPLQVQEGVHAAMERGWAKLIDHRLCPTPLGRQHADALGALFVTSQ